MKMIFAILLCLMLMMSLVLPVAATESSTASTAPSSSTSVEQARDAAYGNPTNANVMAVICVIIIVLGGAYLIFGVKRSRDL